jgi:uncharacterized protein YndB with AHSA1/START domain
MKPAVIRSVVLLTTVLFSAFSAQAEVKPLPVGGYSVELDVTLSAAPEAVYDAATGDISSWWDHSFSEHPKKIYIEAKPAGGFYEIFNDSGDGVLHATVTWAERGKRLRFVGPLGLAGNAVDLVTTWDFKPEATGTRMHVTCNAVGQLSADTAKILDQVWHHFIAERLKPYVDSGEYLKKTTGKPN